MYTRSVIIIVIITIVMIIIIAIIIITSMQPYVMIVRVVPYNVVNIIENGSTIDGFTI